jgi:hypothetical protein
MTYSCKENKSQTETDKNIEVVTTSKNEANKDKLKVFFDAVISNDAKIKLFYNDGNTISTIDGNPVKGKPSMIQRVSFVFPEKVIPSSFYLLFDKANEITLNKIVVNMNDDRIIIKDSAFFEYFEYNKNTLKVEEYNLTLTQLDTLKASKSLINRMTNRYSKYLK